MWGVWSVCGVFVCLGVFIEVVLVECVVVVV